MIALCTDNGNRTVSTVQFISSTSLHLSAVSRLSFPEHRTGVRTKCSASFIRSDHIYPQKKQISRHSPPHPFAPVSIPNPDSSQSEQFKQTSPLKTTDRPWSPPKPFHIWSSVHILISPIYGISRLGDGDCVSCLVFRASLGACPCRAGIWVCSAWCGGMRCTRAGGREAESCL